MAPLAYAFEDVPFRDAVVEAKAATAFDFGFSSVLLEKTDDFLCWSAKSLALPRWFDFKLPAGAEVEVDALDVEFLFWAAAAVLSSPKKTEERPPGGACTRVDGRSVSTLPLF